MSTGSLPFLDHPQSWEIPVDRPLSHVAMLSLRRKKRIVFARQALTRHKFSARLAMQKKAFSSSETQHGYGVTKVSDFLLVKVIVWPLLLYHLRR